MRAILILVLVTVFQAGCASAKTATRTVAPATPPLEPATSLAAPVVPPDAPAPLAVPSPEVGVTLPNPDPVASQATEDIASDNVEEVLREAVELCQSANDLLRDGDPEAALAAADQAYELMLSLPVREDSASAQAKEDIRILVADIINHVLRPGHRAAAGSAASWDLAFQVEANEHVKREIASFLGPERDEFIAGYQRSGLYRPMILARLEKAGLPSQLSWLPLVESWFKIRALSRASALGMWQFISSTGQRYGLGRNAWVDERMDPEKSTDGAIAYLTELHALFGDWPKALAGYNCGEGRVQRLQRRGTGYLDFWDLYAQLPRETRRYVPRLFAALLIIENPGKYGLTLPEPTPALAGLEVARIEKPVQLSRLDGVIGLPEGTLAALNPELRHQATPEQAYDLKVPIGNGSKVAAASTLLPAFSRPRPSYNTHRVRRGETLSLIARRYRTNVQAILRLNRLRSAHRIWPGQSLRIPTRGQSAPRSTPPPRTRPTDGRYQVAPGDTLSAIARSLQVSLDALLRTNGLQERSRIYPGQVLTIPN